MRSFVLSLFMTVTGLAIFNLAAHASTSADIANYTRFLNENFAAHVQVVHESDLTLPQLEQLELYLRGELNLPDHSLIDIQCDKPACTGGGGGGCGKPVCAH